MKVPHGLPLKEDGSCGHLENNLCSIWEDRPDFCRSELMRPPGMEDKEYEEARDRACEWLRENFPETKPASLPPPLHSD